MKTQVLNAGFLLPLTIEQVEDGSYMATSSQLPGFLVLAETIDEIFQLAPDIAKELIEAMKVKGVQPPIISEEIQFPFDVEVLVL